MNKENRHDLNHDHDELMTSFENLSNSAAKPLYFKAHPNIVLRHLSSCNLVMSVVHWLHGCSPLLAIHMQDHHLLDNNI